MCTLCNGGSEIYGELLTMNMMEVAVANIGIEPIAIAITSASIVGCDLHLGIEVDPLPDHSRATTAVATTVERGFA